jgi:hypothetical protein
MNNYRLQHRLGASNIIEKKVIGDNGKEKWIPFVAPLGPKESGDKTAEKLLNFFNNN